MLLHKQQNHIEDIQIMAQTVKALNYNRIYSQIP